MPNKSFLLSHKSLLEDEDRMRVAYQLHAILEDWYGGSLEQLEILDYGCSNGIITNFIANYSKKMVGIDVDGVAIKKANEKHKLNNLSFLLTKGVKIPFKNE